MPDRSAAGVRASAQPAVGVIPVLLWVVVFAALAAEVYHEAVWYGALLVIWLITVLGWAVPGHRTGRHMGLRPVRGFGWLMLAVLVMLFDTVDGLFLSPFGWAAACVVVIAVWHVLRWHGQRGGVGLVARMAQISVAVVALGAMLAGPLGLRSDVEFLYQVWRHGQPRTVLQPQDMAAPDLRPGRFVVIEGLAHCPLKSEEGFHLFDCSELLWTRVAPQVHDPMAGTAASGNITISLQFGQGLVSRPKTPRHAAEYHWRDVRELSSFISEINQRCATFPAVFEGAPARCNRMKEEIAAHLWLTVPEQHRDTLRWDEWTAAVETGRVDRHSAYVMDGGQAVLWPITRMNEWVAEQRVRHMVASYRAPTDGVRLKLVAGERERWPESFRLRKGAQDVVVRDRNGQPVTHLHPVTGIERLQQQVRGEPFRISGVLRGRGRGTGGDGMPQFELDARRSAGSVEPVRARVLAVLLAAIVVAWQGGELLAMALRRRPAA